MIAITPEQALQIAVAQQEAGQFAAAEATCRRVLAGQPGQPGALHRLGLLALATNRAADAVEPLAGAVAAWPARADCRCDLGLALRLLGRCDEAIAHYHAALELDPMLSNAWLNLGEVLASTGRTDEAAACYRRAIAISPADANALNNLGNLLGKTPEAIQCFERAVASRADFAEAHYNLGNALSASGRHEEAIAALRHALMLRPRFAEAHNNLGIALKNQGRLDEAVTSYQCAVELRPDFVEAHNNLGIALKQLGRFDEAIECHRRAVVCRGDLPESHFNLGVALGERGRADEARASYESALQLRPDYADAHNNLGTSLLQTSSLDEATRHFERALECDPASASAQFNIALINLLLGRYEEGWRGYEMRWQTEPPSHPQRKITAPRWDGSPVPGRTILVHADQGLGDAIHFLRYVPFVRERSQAARVLLEIPWQLVRLFEQSGDFGAEIIARHTWEDELPAADLQVPLLSLPLTLRLFEPLTMPQPYLRSTRRAEFHDAMHAESGRTFRIGLAWAGNPAHENDRNRSIPFEKLAPLPGIEGVRLFSLQIPKSDSQTAGITDLTAHITGFADTAALMAELDLIISVDTAAAHLAGALGRPVWTLLPMIPDWRWGIEGDDTPWYPTMRLFRQTVPGDWDSVVQRVADEVQRLIS